MVLAALIDSIRTGFGCLPADIRCASAEIKAKHNGIDTDAIKECMYGQLENHILEQDPKAADTKESSRD